MRGKYQFWLHLFLVLSLIIITATVNLNLAYANPSELRVDPFPIIDKTKQPGTTFSININVIADTNIVGFEFKLKFDTTILDAIQINKGDFFEEPIGSPPGGPVLQWHKEINNTYYDTLGRVWYGLSFGSSSNYYGIGKSGDGTLATIDFVVEDVGAIPLDLYDTKLLDPSGWHPIEHAVRDGYFSNTGYANPVAGFTFTSPSMSAEPPSPNPILGEPVTFNAAYDPLTGGSYDIDGYIASWDWDFGDGSTGSEEIVEHVYTEAGTYTVTLTVTDNATLTNTDTEDVKLTGHNLAVINVQPNQTYVMQNRTISISVTVKNKGSETEHYNVTAYYNGIPVAPLKTDGMGPKYNKTLTFLWNTSGVAPGTYIISANVIHVPEEYDLDDVEYILDDNTKEDGTVTVVLTPVADIAVIDIATSPSMVFVGDNVNIDVTVANQGLTTETFDASVYYDTNLIDTQTYITMPQLTKQKLTFTWNTASVPWGVYSISANISTVLDEINTDNNNLTDGTVGVALNNIKVLSLSAPTSAVVGTTVTIETVLKNEGKQTATFTVFFYYDNTLITDPQTVTDLAPSDTKSLTVLWDTTSLATGVPYTIKVKVPPLPGELVVTDNELTQLVSLVPPVHNIAITALTANPTTVIRGKTVNINVTIQNIGNVDETVSASVSYDTTLIETKTGITLTVGESKTLNFTWNTPANVALKMYTIKAEAQIPEDTDTTDNTKTTQVTVAIHDITVVSVTASKTEVAAGESVDITVVVKNQGNFTESFSVTAKYGDNPIGTPINVNNLAKQQTKTVTFSWNTTGVSPGTYKIKASASTVPDEEDTTNNIQEDGTVTVKLRSTVSISASSDTVTVGDKVTISGSIDPTRSRVTVTLWYRLTGTVTWNNLTATQTNTASQYSCTWTPSAAGTYEVKTSWEGDSNTQPSESTIFIIKVNEAPTGVPLYLVAAVGAIVIVAISIAAYSLIRKKH